METHFGRDFSAVRIHTGGEARSAASRLGAEAFAVGTSIAFGAGRFQPGTVKGRQLLAHELTHVAQQGGAPITRGGAAPEAAAANVGESSGGPMLSMRGPAARMPVRPPPLRTVPRTRARGSTSRGNPTGLEGVPYHQRYAPPRRFDNSLHAMMWRASAKRERQQAIFQGQIPWATLSRGGKAPRFVTPGIRQSIITGAGHVVHYTSRNFHILDAIEYDVSKASTQQDLQSIVLRYLPNTWLGRSVFVDEVLKGRSHNVPLVGPLWSFQMHKNFDPLGEKRIRVLAVAVKKRAAVAPKIRQAPLAKGLEDMLMVEGVKRKAGKCKTQAVPRRGGHHNHDTFAKHVTGSSHDFQITTPEGIQCTTDGLDANRQAWEVKTGYRYLSDAGIIWVPTVTKFHELFSSLEEQRARCLYVTARCGYPYAYAFDRPEVANFMRVQWSNLPPVFYIKPPYHVTP